MLPVVTAEFRAAADPELRFAPSGTAVCNLRAVSSSRKKNEAGEWVDDKNCWVTLTGFKRIAENMAESIERGDLVNVVGKIYTDDWEDKEGNKRTSIRINVDAIGVSLAFNTAKAQRTERSSSSSGSQPQSQPSEDPFANTNPDDPPF